MKVKHANGVTTKASKMTIHLFILKSPVFTTNAFDNGQS